ncbi:MAG: hypothetical protein RLZZ360_982 [Candidatus Parcubacteria bacterium]|jgi:hypothetical protein
MLNDFFRHAIISVVAFIPAMLLPHPGWNEEEKDKNLKK